MGEGLTYDLLFTAGCVGALCALIASRSLPWSWAAVITVARLALPTAYFAWYYHPEWNLIDDLTYFEKSLRVVDRGFGPLSVLLSSEGRDYLYGLSNGRHFLYLWWNLLAVELFGEHYFGPVFLNVATTFVTGGLLFRMVLAAGFSDVYARCLQVFFLLHWDTWAWSSLINLKDPLVLMISAAAMLCCVSYFRDRRLRWIVGFLLVAQLFYWIRFYVPVLMLVAVGAWTLTQWRDDRKLLILPAAAAGLYLALPYFHQHSELLRTDGLLFGMARFTLTPLPWSIEPGFSYLQTPSMLHLASLPIAALGAWALWVQSPSSRLLLIYLVSVVMFYAVVEELQGPRHRVQLLFIFAWLHFHCLWYLKQVYLTEQATEARQPSLPQMQRRAA